MNSCSEKSAGFKRIMSDGLDSIVALRKQCTFSNSIKITQNNVLFFISSNYMNTGGNFQCAYETKKSSMEKMMRLMLEEVIMSDRHISDGQMYSFLQLFFNIEKISLN